eukprot:4581806-Amphidinium_carterae.1
MYIPEEQQKKRGFMPSLFPTDCAVPVLHNTLKNDLVSERSRLEVPIAEALLPFLPFGFSETGLSCKVFGEVYGCLPDL